MKTSYQSPVYKIRRVPLDQIRSNAYNPNSVAPPEMKLLYQSIKEDGYTMPIVCYKLEDGTYEIVDGFHRCQIMKTYRDIYEREGGMMPVAVIDKPLENRMASTIRHNRARGSHNIALMTNIIQELTEAGMSDAWILKNLGMDAEELLRLKQLSGIASLFRDEDSAGHGNRNNINPESMNKYVAQLLEVIQKKTGCDTSGAVRWLANQAGVSERTAWYWKQQEKLRKATEKNLGRIAEELKK